MGSVLGGDSCYPDDEWEPCTESPPCSDLLSDPVGVLQTPERWPTHLCADIAMQAVQDWAEHLYSLTFPNIGPWPGCWPLPVGIMALQQAHMRGNWWGQPLAMKSLLPFEHEESAMLILRLPLHDATITFFGLAGPLEPWTPLQRRSRYLGLAETEFPPVARTEMDIPGWTYVLGTSGEVTVRQVNYLCSTTAFIVIGGNPASEAVTSLVSNARRWWSQFEGKPLRGRRHGTTSISSPDEIIQGYSDFVGDHSRRPSQDELAERLYVGSRTLKRALKRFAVPWPPVR